jgi:hypothetical protein
MFTLSPGGRGKGEGDIPNFSHLPFVKRGLPIFMVHACLSADRGDELIMLNLSRTFQNTSMEGAGFISQGSV